MSKTIMLWIILACLSLPFSSVANDTLFRFAHVTDTHIGSATAEMDLMATIEDINNQKDIAFVIVTGDITDFGSDDELRLAKSLLNKINKPWYVVPGNHDTKWSESGATSFHQIFGGETFQFEHKGFWFIGTSSGPNMRMGPGQVPRENLVWLDSLLHARQDHDQPIIFINHYPLNNSLNNWYEIMERLKNRNLKAILCGHGHSNRLMDFEGVPGIMGRSNLRAKDQVGGYNIVSVTDHSIIYNERKPGISTIPAWCTIPLARNERPRWASVKQRPDYDINKQYTGVKEQWVIQENSDIGSGVGFYKNRIVYTTTAGWIKAVKVKDGKLLWSFKAPGKIYATPLVIQNSVVIPDTKGNIFCLDVVTGNLKWRYETKSPIVSSAAGYSDRVIIAGSDGHCRALSLQSGKLLWDYPGINNFVETKLLVTDSIIYFGSWGNEVYAINAINGKLIWKWMSGHTNRMFSAAACWPVISGKQLFLVAPDRHMTVLDKETGSLIWRNYDSLNFVRESMGISTDKRQVYVKTMQGQIQAIDAVTMNRKVNWVSAEQLGFDVCPSPINEYGGIVYVPSQSGMVYALSNDTGNLIWKYKISNCLVSTVQPLDSHTLIASSMDGKISCLSYQ